MGRHTVIEDDVLANLESTPAKVQASRCRDLGGAGVMILGGAGDKHLDHPEVAPFFAAAEELDLPVAVHAGRPRAELADLFENAYDQIVLPPLVYQDGDRWEAQRCN